MPGSSSARGDCEQEFWIKKTATSSPLRGNLQRTIILLSPPLTVLQTIFNRGGPGELY